MDVQASPLQVPGASNPSGVSAEDALAPYLLERPWRLEWQLLVALVGGVMPAAAIAWLNGRRLGLSAGRMRLILLVGLIGLLTVIGLSWYRVVSIPLIGFRMKLRAVRLTGSLVGLGCGGLLWLLQRGPDRAYRARGGGHGSLWAPGLMAVLLFGIPQRILIAALVLLLTR